MGALPEEPPVFASEGTLPWLCSWRWTESVPWAHCPKSYPPVLYLPVRAHCPGFALWRSGPSPCRGRTARRAVSILPMRAHCPGLLLAEWTESVPWAHCPKSCINFANEGALPWLALGGGPSPCQWAHCPKSYLHLPVRAHCPGSFVYL